MTTPTAYPAWETQFLNGIGAPLTANNYGALALWEKAEGGLPINNPMNISGTHPGSTGKCVAQCNGKSPIYGFDNLTDGVNANVTFLQAKGNGYPAIISAFQQDAGLKVIWSAINQSGWCKGCSGGTYPNALYQAAGSPNPTGIIGQLFEGGGPFAGGGIATAVGAGGQVASAVAAPINTVDGFITAISNKQLWERIGMGTLGVGLFVIGLLTFLANTDAGKKAVKEGGEVAAVAAVA